LVNKEQLISFCAGCVKADWENNVCLVLYCPREVWSNGGCWARDTDPGFWPRVNQEMIRYARRKGRSPHFEALMDLPGDKLLGWLMSTRNPDYRSREPILHLPAPPARGSNNKSKRKKNKPVWYNCRQKYLEV